MDGCCHGKKRWARQGQPGTGLESAEWAKNKNKKKLKMGMFGGTEESVNVTQAPDWQLEVGGRVRVSGARRVCLKLTWVVPG